MAKVPSPSSRLKRSAILNLVLLVVLLILANLAASFKFTRFDLTSERRYSLSDATISLLENLDDYVYVKVYLEGDLPANYTKLRNSTKELLDEFRAYSSFVEYEFINPSESENEKERRAIYQQLLDAGLTYTNPVEQKASGVSQTLIWPGALITFKTRTLPLQLLRSQTYANEEELITRSVNDLEYEMTNTIRKLGTVIKPRICFIEGHGELDSLDTKDVTISLEEYYAVERKRLDSNLTSLVLRAEKGDTVKFIPRYKAIIIARPDSAFSEKDKFIIDQYIMRGGKVLWLINKVDASMDSLNVYSNKFVYPIDLNLDDQLFRYGARVNPDLVADLRASVIPVVAGMVGNQPRFIPKRWPFFPLSLPASKHPVVNNLNATRFEFVSTVDTVGAPDIKKTILLSSSKRSRILSTPARISLNILRETPDPRQYSSSGLPFAVLLEGSFTSIFRNRMSPQIRNSDKIGFLESSVKPGAMIVVGDGDVIKNSYSRTTGRMSPLGYDRYTGELFGNKDFILNCVNYLCDDSGLISVRSREVKLRLLDETQVKSSRTSIQIRNVLVPILLILVSGLILSFLRKRKFGRNHS
ncbi:MAG TPA: gliding motility-associated ABC transporter substrate-binding protein GldG [Flavobacteriales bacterium]|nr:gliding motility-associated ABC transporter substrate-binding protein GldG [Flavobacteriales bacterium]HPH81990.1 gliding motility-associated ABC transporter substrate-binding protein GldG [Flavobacteriales bacterium]